MANPSIAPLHRRRLRDIHRSAGWPCQDSVEIELLAARLVERVRGPLGHETLRLTDAGIALLAETLEQNRARRGPHEALVERIATELTRAGRLAWRGLSLRAKVGDAWAVAMPDVYSIRHTSVEAYLEPTVHEIKVSRGDLLGDLRKATKRAAYQALCSECWYVIREGIASADEIPAECGVLVAGTDRLTVERAAQKRPMRMPFHLWMALARSAPLPGWQAEDAQGCLGDTRPN